MPKQRETAQCAKATEVIEALGPCRDALRPYWWCAKHQCYGTRQYLGTTAICDASGEILLVADDPR